MADRQDYKFEFVVEGVSQKSATRLMNVIVWLVEHLLKANIGGGYWVEADDG